MVSTGLILFSGVAALPFTTYIEAVENACESKAKEKGIEQAEADEVLYKAIELYHYAHFSPKRWI